MEWTDLVIETEQKNAEAAADIATLFSEGGLYIEDYADIEKQVWDIAHVDLIEQDLLEKPKNIVKIHIYISPKENTAKILENLQKKYFAAGIECAYSSNAIQQEDWEAAWKQYYHPIEIGARLAVAPSWEAYESGRVTLRLDPGMAFGTGTHETTHLCLEVLDETIKGGETVLDIGTGSGILAIAALLLGAKSALGVDIDPLSVRTATENAQRNNVLARFRIECGDLAATAKGKYDVITTNIIADAIIRLAPSIGPLLTEEGLFLASGIIAGREDEVVEALTKYGLQIREIRRDGDWVAILAGK